MRNYVNVATKKKIVSTTALVAGILMIASSSNAQTATPTNSWDYDTVLGGNVGKDTSVAGITDITVTGGNGYVAGNADIYKGHTVNVTGDAGNTFAYRDNRADIQSTLNGNLNSNMNIIIIDRDGLFFTKNSVIDVNGIAATTGKVGKNDVMNADGVLNIKDIDETSMIVHSGTINAKEFAIMAAGNVWNNGTIVTEAGGTILLAAADQMKIIDGKKNRTRFKIDSNDAGFIVNTGTMDAGKSGLAAIVSPFAMNSGVIKARAGTVTIAAAEKVTLDFYGDGLVEVALEGELSDALINNGGTIAAKGGVVNITAKAAKNAVDNLINNDGIITASSAVVDGGKIILSGGDHGTVNNSGKIKTNAGGSVDISGERYTQTPPVPGAKPSIKSGGANIKIAVTGDVDIAAGVVNAQGGNVDIANGGTFASVSEAVKTKGSGTITLNQNAGGSIQAAVDAIKNTGAGLNTVNVGAGTYNEFVIANHKNLTLKGANAGTHGAGIRGAESNVTSMQLLNDNVTVDGFKAKGMLIAGSSSSAINNIVTDGGINALFANDITIERNQVIGALGSAIAVGFSQNVNINNNTIGNSGAHAINVQMSDAVNIGQNIIMSSNSDGINLMNTTKTKIDSNVIMNSVGDGIDVSGAPSVEITRNFITDNGGSGITVDDSNGAKIDGNKVINSSANGINVTNSDDARIKSNIVSVSGANSISVKDSSFAKINLNTLSSAADSGIYVSGGQNVNIKKNDISDAEGNGLEVSGSNAANIVNNEIRNVRGNGIDVSASSDANIRRNNIIGTGADGIHVDAIGGGIINNNISFALGDGIHAEDSADIKIKRNTIGLVTGDGIDVSGSNNANIGKNSVQGAFGNGIKLLSSENALVSQNQIEISGLDGINVVSSVGAKVKQNQVLRSGDNGIEISRSENSIIKGNAVGYSTNDGINVAESNYTNVKSNIVGFSGNNGIDISDSGGTNIKQNLVLMSSNNGIQLSNSPISRIKGNIVSFSGHNGIDVRNFSAYADINQNYITQSGNDGVHASDSLVVRVKGNTISLSDDDGVDVEGNEVALIVKNTISQSGDDGINASYSGGIIMRKNVISKSGDDGIDLDYVSNTRIIQNTITDSGDDGVDLYNVSNSLIRENSITDSGDDGIRIAGSGFSPAFFEDSASRARAAVFGASSVIENNEIVNSGGDGIQIEDLSEAEIVDNTVSGSGEHGLYVSGFSNGNVVLQGNEFDDNGDEDFAQARFESGDIDFSDLTNPNTFTKTAPGTGVAMQFDDISGGFSSPSDSFELAFISPFGTGLRIVNETLGSTQFTGYTGAGNFYVRLEDGSLLDPVTSSPIAIDGTNASFDGIVPANFANTTLPLATLQFIEDRLYDADDSVVNGRGQIFTGFVETIDGPANFQDFLPEFQNSAPLNRFASVTIRDLPSIGNFGGGAGAGGLNDIAPAAGGENEGENLAGIEPAAGGSENVTCLEDAVNNLGSGAVTYNFGGTFEETIAGASGCQSGAL